MNIKSIKVGPLQCNCYLLDNGKEALLVDPGDEYDKIKKFIEGYNIIAIILTHGHFDHVGCVAPLTKQLNIPVYDSSNLKEGLNQISTFHFQVIETFGHTMDSITYYFKEDKIMLTGDFLFYNTIGRCDLEGSNEQKMLNSIEKIKKYPDDIIIYPGHGKATTLGREKEYNPYF